LIPGGLALFYQAFESSGIPWFSTSWQAKRVAIALLLSEIVIN